MGATFGNNRVSVGSYMDVNKSISDAIKGFQSNIALQKANALAEEDRKLAQEDRKRNLERQVITDAQNKQIFDWKVDAAKKEEQMAKDEEAYLKGVAQPGMYGVKAGYEDLIEALGRFDSTGKGVEAAMAAGPGSKLYEDHFKRMGELGNLLTGTGIDDRTIGYATANPNNMFAAKEALKADVGRQSALDTEAKNIADKIEGLELAKIKAGASTTTKGTAKTAGGYSVKDPGSVVKDVYSMFKTQHGLKSDQAIHGKAAKLAANMAKQGYDASQIVSTLNSAYTPAKDIPWGWDQKESFQTTPLKESPKNIAYTAPTDTGAYDSFRKSYETKLKDIEAQRSGKSGMAEWDAIINGKTSSTTPKTPKIPKQSEKKTETKKEGVKKEEIKKEIAKVVESKENSVKTPKKVSSDTSNVPMYKQYAGPKDNIPQTMDELIGLDNGTLKSLIPTGSESGTVPQTIGEMFYGKGSKLDKGLQYIKDLISGNTEMQKNSRADVKAQWDAQDIAKALENKNIPAEKLDAMSKREIEKLKEELIKQKLIDKTNAMMLRESGQ